MLRRQAFAYALGLALAATGCEEKKTEAPAAPAPTAGAAPATGAAPAAGAPAAGAAPAGAAPAAPTGDTGEVRGVVTISGKLPPAEDLKRNSDPFCAQKQMKDEQVVTDGKGHLTNVVVHINGLPATPAPKEKVTVSQDQCMYRPRVVGVVTGQELDIRNGDPVLHNVHIREGARTTFNAAHVPGAANIQKTFTTSGTIEKMACDIHPWMTGYVWVQNNPYFAVSDADGKIDIKDVPVGTWDYEAWHERFGTVNGKVTVQKGKPAEIKVEFTSGTTAAK